MKYSGWQIVLQTPSKFRSSLMYSAPFMHPWTQGNSCAKTTLAPILYYIKFHKLSGGKAKTFSLKICLTS